MNLRNPLAEARNHGSAHDGVHHWWQQRLSALALFPLLIWLLSALPAIIASDYQYAQAWLARPWNAALSVLLSWMIFHHAWLGVQVVVEDYIHQRWLEVTLLVSARLLAYGAAAVASLFIVLIAV
ncbi:MAG: succinate dehydrogenase, hydrophobic membrane anchor protein [Wenzhouxiangellaceae bacterium]